MRITLEVVRKVLRRGLGQQCFTAGFITKVLEDPHHASASITRDGVLRYGPTFVERHLTCPEDLFCLLLHELLHPLWAHFIHSSGKLQNIAADAVINAAITTLYADPSGEGHLFRSFYQPQGLEGLLRPDSQMEGDLLERVYHRLYPQQLTHPSPDRSSGAYPLTTGELIRTLRILLDEEELGHILLLGSHREGAPNQTGGEKGQDTPWDRGLLSQIARDLEGALSDQGGMQAGRGSQLRQLLSVVLRSHLGLREDLLARFATTRNPDRFLEERHLLPTQRISPLPLSPSRREVVLLSGGAYPLHYHHTICEQTSRYRGLALYLDVSGSATCYLPQILGVLRRLRGRLGSIYQFSNQVVETTLEALLDGEIQTTYGTDFDCVAQSILDHGFERAMVITDGYAQLSRRLKDELLQRKAGLLTILFGQARTCDPLAPLGEVVPLEKVCV